MGTGATLTLWVSKGWNTNSGNEHNPTTSGMSFDFSPPRFRQTVMRGERLMEVKIFMGAALHHDALYVLKCLPLNSLKSSVPFHKVFPDFFKKEVGIRPAPPPGRDKIPSLFETLRCMAPLLVKIVLNLVWLKAVCNGGGFWKRRDGERNPGSCCPIWWTNHHHYLVILLQQSPFPCYQVKSSLFAKSIPEPIEKLA